jgi:membrane protease YdiL (CAAX protease family)
LDSAEPFAAGPGEAIPFTPVPTGEQIPPLPLPPLPMGLPGLEYVSAPARPRVWTVFVMFLAALVAFIIVNIAGGAVVALIALRGQNIGSVNQFVEKLPEVIAQPWAIMSLGLMGQLTLLASAVIAAMVSPVPFANRLALARSSLPIWAYPLVMLGALAVAILYSQIVELLHIKPGGALRVFDELFKQLTPVQTVVAVLILGVMPGFAEEWMFRGYIQSRLSRAWGRWPAIGIAAALFGLMHMDLWQSPFAFFFGIYLGYLAEKAGSIRPTMICHMFNNSFQILLVTVLAPYISPTVEKGIVICCLVALPLAIVYLRFAVWPPVRQDEQSLPQPLALDPAYFLPPVA